MHSAADDLNHPQSESIYVYIYAGPSLLLGCACARLFLSAHTHCTQAGSGIESCDFEQVFSTRGCWQSETEKPEVVAYLLCTLPLYGPVLFGARISAASKTAVELDFASARISEDVCGLYFMWYSVSPLFYGRRPDAFWVGALAQIASVNVKRRRRDLGSSILCQNA